MVTSLYTDVRNDSLLKMLKVPRAAFPADNICSGYFETVESVLMKLEGIVYRADGIAPKQYGFRVDAACFLSLNLAGKKSRAGVLGIDRVAN